ncbi:hypothetical protein NKH77_46850 [Streptomyces sp. M19]
MSRYHYVFIKPGQPAERLVSDISTACGTRLRPVDDEFIDYAANLGSSAVEVELTHEYEEAFGMPFEKYDALCSVRDFESDLTRQGNVARQIFANLASLNRYSLLLTLDLQVLIDTAEPQKESTAE